MPAGGPLSSRRWQALRIWPICALLLLLAPGTPVLLSSGAAQDDGLEAPRAPWWGPGDPGDPTVGYHFRFPIVVTNPHTYPLDDPVPLVEVDLGELLGEAGWPSRSVGAASSPTSFELDPDSFRVVRYTSGFADIDDPEALQSRFYPGRFSVAAEAPYDPARNPVGTLAFPVDGTLSPGETRSYMVYFTSARQGDRPDHDEHSPLDGWPGRGWGTDAYGHQPTRTGGSLPRTDVIARHAETQVKVFEFEGGGPSLADLPDNPNPMTLDAGGSATLAISGKTFFKVEADKPVLVSSRGGYREDAGTFGGGGFVPSTGPSFSGKTFQLPAYAPQLVVSLTEFGKASVTATLDGDTVDQTQLSSARLTDVLAIPVSGSRSSVNVIEVTSDGPPITVQYGAPVLGTHTVPARTGGVGGVDTFTLAPAGTSLQLQPRGPAEVRVLDPLQSSQQLFPFGDVSSEPPSAIRAFPPSFTVAANESFPASTPVRVLSTSEEGPATPISVSAGTGDPAGPFYLDGELTTATSEPVAVMGAYNGTRVSFTERVAGENLTQTQTVNRDGIILFEPDSASPTDEALVQATKPVTILSTTPLDDYARAYPAYGARPSATVGSLDFRGAFVEASIEGGLGGQSVLTIGPDEATEFDVEVRNGGHWLQGASITETVELTCSEAGPSWTVRGCGETFRLSSGQSREATIKVQPEDVSPGTRLLLKVSAQGQPWNTTDEGQITLLVREDFGVDAWFFAEGGPKDLRDTPFSVDRGGERAVSFVVKNTGTVEDSFDLRLLEPPSGWSMEILDGNEPVNSVALKPGETTELNLQASPGTDPAQLRSPVDLEIVSLSNELAATKLVGSFEILSDLNLTVTTPEPLATLAPGENHSFPLVVENRGESVVDVEVDALPALPETWTMHVPLSQISIFPGNETTLSVHVATPEDAPAGERGTINLEIQASRNPGETPTVTRRLLTGLLEHVHDLGVPTEPVSIETGPDQTLNVPLINKGNGEESVRIIGLVPAWTAETSDPLIIPQGETAILSMSIDVPPQTPPGDRNLTIHASLGREAVRNLTVPLHVEETVRLSVNLEDPPPLLPGKPVTLDARVTSTGNVPLEGPLQLQLPDDWQVSGGPGNVSLAPGEELDTTFEVTAPASYDARSKDLTFTVDRETGSRAEAGPFTLPAGRPDLRVQAASAEERDAGGVLVRATVSNNGTVEARDVSLALVRDGQPVSSTTIERISPGGEALVTVVDSRSSDTTGLQLVADPDERLPDPDRSNNVVDVGADAIPGPAPVLIAVALAGLAALRPTRWDA